MYNTFLVCYIWLELYQTILGRFFHNDSGLKNLKNLFRPKISYDVPTTEAQEISNSAPRF